MSALSAIREGFVGLGYAADSIRHGYRYGDVLAEGARDLRIDLAAFVSTPTSYRSAAFGVIEGAQPEAVELARKHRSLGAPYLFVVSGDAASLWTYDEEGQPVRDGEVATGSLEPFFREHGQDWTPDAIRRAKRARSPGREAQGSLFDGLFQNQIAHVTRTRLDSMVSQALAQFGEPRDTLTRPLYRSLFRLLAAKVLADRGHEAAAGWRGADVTDVLNGISRHYGLGTHSGVILEADRLTRSWQVIAGGFSLANVSADDLAFVYENTFVTAKTRADFATHSTPAVVAEHVVGAIDFDRFDLRELKVYEPFCGASPLLLAAMGRVRDLLPVAIGERERHDVLVRTLSGDDADPFAVEVSRLSLILGDWPNGNGWDVREADLLEAGRLDGRLLGADVVLCNPPFEAFGSQGKARYPQMAANGKTKGAAVLARIVAARPSALGIVMPRTLLQGSTFEGVRRAIEKAYGTIKTVSLPDKVFLAAGLETSLLVAQDPRIPGGGAGTRIVSEVVRDADRKRYLTTGAVSARRATFREPDEEAAGELWVRSLEELWQHLRGSARLGDVASIHRGLEWRGNQTLAISHDPRPGYVPGLGNIAGSLHQFAVGRRTYLNVEAGKVRRALAHPWERPKVIVNAVRHGRGRWPLAAAVDRNGLRCSQQFFGVWPHDAADLEPIGAVLNGPLANAHMIDGSSMKGLRVDALASVPLPHDLASLRGIGAAVDAYAEEVAGMVFQDPATVGRLTERLHAIDRVVLRAYALPTRLEDELLDFFVGHEGERTVQHPASHWWATEIPAEAEGVSAEEAAFLRLLDGADAGRADSSGRRLAGLLARLDALVGDMDIDLDAPIEDDLA